MKSNGKNFVKRLQRQKEDALEYIVDEYLSLAKGISFKILGTFQNEGLVDECVNDIFLSIWENAAKFKGDTTNFKYWLASIARFKAIDYYRKVVKNTEVGLENQEFIANYSIEDEIIQVENQEEILSLIRTLDPIDQEILIMRYFLDMKPEEIAAKVGLTDSAVNSRIYRGRKKLKIKAGNFIIGGNLG